MKIAARLMLPILIFGYLTTVMPLSAAERSKTATMSLEQRLERLERILRNQSLADIILQLQQLQQEVQQLRGELELQSHTLDSLSKRQRDLYLDIDQRLSSLQTAPAGSIIPPGNSVTAAPSVPEAPRPTSTAQPAASKKPSPPDPKRESAAYQKAFNLLKQGRYPESAAAFQAFLNKYPGGNYEDNAQYWLGEASYVSRDFETALKEFNKVLENYPDSSKVPGALLKSGYIYYEKRDWIKARETFNRLQQDYATSTEARLAGKRLQRMDKEGH